MDGTYGFERERHDRAEKQDLTTVDVENTTVYGRNNETIGSISTLKAGTDGEITHSVSLPFNQPSVLLGIDGGDPRVALVMTKT